MTHHATCTPGRARGLGGPAAGAQPRPSSSRASGCGDESQVATSVSLDRCVRCVGCSTTPAFDLRVQARRMQKNMQTTDAEFELRVQRRATLGVRTERWSCPWTRADDEAHDAVAEKHKVSVRTHARPGQHDGLRRTMAMSKWNMINVDLGHYVAPATSAARRSVSRSTTGAFGELPPEGSDAASMLADRAVRSRRRAGQGDPADGAEE